MNRDAIDKMLSELPDPVTPLTDKYIKQIQRSFPVPTDYKILWADIVCLGGHPAGVVITDRALIVKASKDEVDAINKKIKEENKNKDKEDRLESVPYIYNIVPWEYLDLLDYSFQEIAAQSYAIKADNMTLANFNSKELYEYLLRQRKYELSERVAIEEAISSSEVLNAANTMFAANNGAANSIGGHGAYAEEWGNWLDIINGEDSTVVGYDHAKNGPDKIVDGAQIQCKWYKDASSTVGAAFERNTGSGKMEYRYMDLAGNPMKLEVPADQYQDVILLIQKRIEKGEIPGINDPKAAYDIVRPGRITYQQALNLARAGTIESLVYDASHAAISCSSAFGITFVVTFAQVMWDTKDPKKAAKMALQSALCVYGTTVFSGVLSAQLARMTASWAVGPVGQAIGQLVGDQTRIEVVNYYRMLAGNKVLTGNDIPKGNARMIGATITSDLIFVAVCSLPDTIKVLKKEISGTQYMKNVLCMSISMVGGHLTRYAVGKIVDQITENPSNWKVKTAIGIAGIGGSILLAKLFQDTWEQYIEDDCYITARLFNAICMNMICDYQLNINERQKLIDALNKDGTGLRKVQVSLLNSEHQEADIKAYLLPTIEEILSSRETVSSEQVAFSAA